MGYFITFEGAEGSGKTTQMMLLATALRAVGYTVTVTREPGGTQIGNAIRGILLNPANKDMVPRAEAMLFNAARAQLVDTVIAPALGEGHIVLCDRYFHSTLAYQGYASGMNMAELNILIAFAIDGYTPDLTLYLDIPPKLGLSRKRTQGDENRFEQRVLDFHDQVRNGYLSMAYQERKFWEIIDATLPVEQIAAQCLQVVQARIAASTLYIKHIDN